jgi:tRNA threonylcarbamoyladenosine biosynthesis protein TsaB
MSATWLILETSGRSRVGLVVDQIVVGTADLGGSRQNNRFLIPTIHELLDRHQITPRGLTGVAVGIGPGSYTGLRVGITAAKTLAYTIGCSLVAVPTFASMAADVPGTGDVIADALQGLIYVQRFENGVAVSELRIEPFDEWVNRLAPFSPGGRGVGGEGVVVAGPGVVAFATKLPVGVHRSAVSEPTVEAVYRTARKRPPLTPEELMRLEPLYMRGSSAEEKAKKLASGTK